MGLSDPIAELKAPAPEAVAVLVTLVGEVFGMFTFKVRVGKLFPEVSVSTVSVQLTVPVPCPVQLQFVPDPDASV